MINLSTYNRFGGDNMKKIFTLTVLLTCLIASTALAGNNIVATYSHM